MRLSRQLLSWFLQVLGLVGIPGDLKLWWNVVIPVIVSTIPRFFAFLQGAQWWLIVLITLGAFVTLFLVSIPAERRISRWRDGASKSTDSSPVAEPEVPRPRRGIIAEDRSEYQDKGSTFYDLLDEGIHLSDDARARTEDSQFGRRQEPKNDSESGCDDEVK